MASSVRRGCSTRASRRSRTWKLAPAVGGIAELVRLGSFGAGLASALQARNRDRLLVVRGLPISAWAELSCDTYSSLRAQWRPTPQLRASETRLVQAIRRLHGCSATAPQRRSYTVAPRATRSSAKGLQTMEIDRRSPLSLTRSSGRLLRTFASKRHPRSWSIHHGDSPPSPGSPPSCSRA